MHNESIRVIRVFVGSPGDCSEHKDQIVRLLNGLNTIMSISGVRLDVTRWPEDFMPTRAGRSQEAINIQIGNQDIHVVLFWKRLGSPTGTEDSGTLEEYHRLHDLGAQCLAYFDVSPVAHDSDLQQLQGVRDTMVLFRNLGQVYKEFEGPRQIAENVMIDVGKLSVAMAAKNDLTILKSVDQPSNPPKIQQLGLIELIDSFDSDVLTITIGLQGITAHMTAMTVGMNAENAGVQQLLEGRTTPIPREEVIRIMDRFSTLFIDFANNSYEALYSVDTSFEHLTSTAGQLLIIHDALSDESSLKYRKGLRQIIDSVDEALPQFIGLATTARGILSLTSQFNLARNQAVDAIERAIKIFTNARATICRMLDEENG